MLKSTTRLLVLTRKSNSQHYYSLSVIKDETKNFQEKPQRQIHINKKIFDHFNSDEEKKVALKYPNKLFTASLGKMPDSFYIADPKAADHIVLKLKKNLSNEKLIIENSSGIGLLTKLLINKTENELLIYENDKELFNLVAEILEKCKDRKVSLKKGDFTSIWKLSYLDELEETNRVDAFLDNVQRKDFNDDTVARLFSCVGMRKFFIDLIRSVVFQNGMLHAGRIEMFLCLPPSVYFSIASSSSSGLYSPLSVLFQLFFEYEFISHLNRKFFLPWRTKPPKNVKLSKIILTDFDKMYLIRVEPRKDLFKYCLPEHLPALWFFVKQNFSSKTDIISTMETLWPGCSSKLKDMKKNYVEPQVLFPDTDLSNILNFVAPSTSLTVNHFISNVDKTNFVKLKPTQILSIFNEFISCPEYENSPFINELEIALNLFSINANDDEDNDYKRKPRST